MYTAIVIPLDGSPFGKRALPLALALARRNDLPVRLLHVHEPMVPAAGELMYNTTLIDEWRGEMRTDLTALAAQLGRETSLPVDAEFLDGSVVPTLVRYLTGRPGSLVVMMTHGRGGVRRAWLGSVADGLVRHAPVPILLVRPGVEWPGKLIEPLFRRVLVPLDGSAMAEEGLDHAVALATPGATVYTLLTVVVSPPLFADFPVPPTEPFTDRANVEGQRTAALAYLGTVAERMRRLGMLVETRIVVQQRPAEAILDDAEAQHVDLIALATHGRGGVSRFFLGSVADKVVRGATVPVLVYHPAGGSKTQDAPGL
jgi:nucleotide-binding universal stress UspA family protein